MDTNWSHAIVAGAANAIVIYANTTAQSTTTPVCTVNTNLGGITATLLGSVVFSDTSGNRGAGYTPATFLDKQFVWAAIIPAVRSVSSVAITNTTASVAGYMFTVGNSVAFMAENTDISTWIPILQTSGFTAPPAKAGSYITTAHFMPWYNWNSSTAGTGGTRLVDNTTYLGGSNIQFGQSIHGFANVPNDFVATVTPQSGVLASSVGVIITPPSSSGFFSMF